MLELCGRKNRGPYMNQIISSDIPIGTIFESDLNNDGDLFLKTKRNIADLTDPYNDWPAHKKFIINYKKLDKKIDLSNIDSFTSDNISSSVMSESISCGTVFFGHLSDGDTPTVYLRTYGEIINLNSMDHSINLLNETATNITSTLIHGYRKINVKITDLLRDNIVDLI